MSEYARIEWNGEKVKHLLEKELRKRVINAAFYWVGEAKKNLSVAGKEVSKKGTGATIATSNPGEYPRKQSGHLRRNVTHEMHDLVPLARVGTNVKYGRILEEDMNRPWMTMTNATTASAIKAIIETGTPL